MARFKELIGKELGKGTFSWDSDMTLLYALGVGAGLAEPLEELQFTTENTPGLAQQVVPTFMTQMHTGGGGWIRQLGFPAREWDGYPLGLVHGEQGVSLARPIPPAGTVDLSQVLVEVLDKGSGALCIADMHATLADTGEYLGASRMGLFVQGQGGFGGPSRLPDEEPWVQPERMPDLTVSLPTAPGQSLIFRLLGDRAPHGTDPDSARADGFEKPIFYGLGTYGFACRALLKGMCEGDVARFGSINGRFSRPVHPGDVLDTHIWRTDDGGGVFRTTVNNERVVIDRGTFRYRA